MQLRRRAYYMYTRSSLLALSISTRAHREGETHASERERVQQTRSSVVITDIPGAYIRCEKSTEKFRHSDARQRCFLTPARPREPRAQSPCAIAGSRALIDSRNEAFSLSRHITGRAMHSSGTYTIYMLLQNLNRTIKMHIRSQMNGNVWRNRVLHISI